MYDLTDIRCVRHLMEKNNFDVMNKQVHDKINQDDKKRNISKNEKS